MTRDEIGSKYLEQLPYPPYPVQEEALLAWFTAEQGVLVCAPTGTGKTLIAQAALFEALHTNTVAYYTTPLIALTEQKFVEMQACAEAWGFSRNDVGMITGNRKVNPHARVLVVVAEILLNRLLHPDGFNFDAVSAVVMDEFHSFADPERGIVWELSLSLLPAKVKLLLLSATVGNAAEFTNWLSRNHGRTVELVEGRERKIPLTYHWSPDEFLNDLLVSMAKGDDATRKTPALVFAFNRDECWSIAEQLKGLDLLNSTQRKPLNDAVDLLDWPQGIGPKLKQMLRRGVGVHHAGLLPKYRRGVERLFEQKLLSVALCTETLAAGINLPARSVVLTSLVKGPFGKEKLIDPSSAHQIFGRAGRPQFDTEGHVYALPHEDDVRIAKYQTRWTRGGLTFMGAYNNLALDKAANDTAAAGTDYDMVNTENDHRFRDYWQTYHAMTERKGVTAQLAKIEMRRRLTLIGAMMLKTGEVDGMLCGTWGTTALHLHYIDQVIGKREGSKTYACMNGLILPGRQVMLVDTHVNYDPTAEQLAEITVMAAEEMMRFGIQPKAALLSHSNFGSSNQPSAIKMRDTLALLRQQAPWLEVDGEMHGDTALDAAHRKAVMPDSPLTGEANLLVLPNIDAANISYNLLKTAAGGGIAIGPVLLGAAQPVHILTPSATVRRIINMTALTVADANAAR